MHNPVVFHAERELFRSGFTTLRFNFRGVGDSQGEYDECRGEVEDLAAAASWLRGVALGLPLFLVGYSFGSVCSIRLAVNDDTVKAVIGIGLPARIFELDDVKRLGRPLTIVQGSEDEFASPDEVRELLSQARPEGRLIEIPGASHLFPDRAREAAAAVVEAADRILPGLAGEPEP